MTKYWLVKINNVDVSADVRSYKVEDTYGFGEEIGKAVIVLKKKLYATLSSSLLPGMTCTIYEDYSNNPPIAGDQIFAGFVASIEEDKVGYKITVYNKLYQALRRQVNNIYKIAGAQSGEVSAIFSDIVTTWAGLSADGGSIQSSGTATGQTLDLFVCKDADCYERMQALAEALGWQFYHKASDDKVYFEPRGFTTNGNVIYIGSSNNNVINKVKWKENFTELINSVKIIGDDQLLTREELFSGDASDTTWDLTYVPIDVQLYYNNTTNFSTTAPQQQWLKVGGILNQSSNQDYNVDKENKEIDTVGFTAGSGSANNILVRYSYSVPVVVQMEDSASMTTYGKTAKALTLLDLKTVTDAETRAQKMLEIYATPFKVTKLRMKPAVVSTLGLEIGQRIYVEDSLNNGKSGWYLIRKIIRKIPETDIEIHIGDKEWRIGDFEASTDKRVKRLEEKMLQNTDLLRYIRNLPSDVALQPRYFKAITQEIGHAFILGSSTNGVLGTANGQDGQQILLGDYRSTAVIARVLNYRDIHYEYFEDTDFKDAGNTTADWDTTNKWLDFTAGEIGVSLAAAANNVTITTAKLTITKSSGTFTLQLSADGGSNWETVTSGTAHTFTDTGTDLRWKITESGASTGRITELKIEDYV